MLLVPSLTPFPEPASLVYTNWVATNVTPPFPVSGLPTLKPTPPPVSTAPTHPQKPRLKHRWVGSLEGSAGVLRRQEGAEGSRHFLHPDLLSATT